MHSPSPLSKVQSQLQDPKDELEESLGLFVPLSNVTMSNKSPFSSFVVVVVLAVL